MSLQIDFDVKEYVSCGDGNRYPDCSACPKSNETFPGAGCKGHCAYDSYTEECKEKGNLNWYIDHQCTSIILVFVSIRYLYHVPINFRKFYSKETQLLPI